MTGVTRRGFFGAAVKAALRAAAEVSQAVDQAQAPDQAPDPRPDIDAIAGDFTPAMLAQEARRLGLDPDNPDRAALLAAVYEAMRNQAPDRGRDEPR